MAIQFFFNFISSAHGRKEIDEPTGFDAAGFNIKQDSGRWGRDVVYSGGEAKFSISPLKNHYFELMMYNRLKFGFEAVVKLEVDFGDGIEVVGDIDFATMSTNKVNRCEFTVVQENTQAIFKRRYDTNINLFSFKDLDGNAIEPCQTVDMLLKAKPIIAVSEWKIAPFDYGEPPNDAPVAPNEFAFYSNGVYFNPMQAQVKYDIKDSLSWLTNFDTDDANNFAAVRALTNLKNVRIEFDTNILYKYRPNEYVSGLDKAGSLGLYVAWGENATQAVLDGNYVTVWYNGSTAESNSNFQLPNQMAAVIPFVNATEKIFVYFRVGSQNGAVNRIQFSGDDSFKITATAIALNTVIPVVRYIDAIKYAVKSASGLETVAPRWEYGGEFYEQYITTALLMRNLRDKPFNITNKDIVENNIRPEVNGDYEIQADSDVFFGLYPDFYRNYEVGRYEQAQFEDFSTTTNERYTLNKVKLGFKNFASNKEAEQDNTLDIVHGNLEGLFANRNVEDSRDPSIGFVRDAFLIEQTRQKAYDISDNTATSDDSKIFIIDAVTLPAGTSFTETAELQHQADGVLLVLKNTGRFSWQLLGIEPPSIFTIYNGDNAGAYFVQSVTDTELTLLASSGTPEDIAAQNTTFKYFIKNSVRLTNRTNEGFSNIQNLEDGNNYANLRFTNGRILRNYFNQELATANLNRRTEPIKITKYENNPDAATQYTGEPLIREGADFLPTNPILTPDLFEMTLIMSLAEYWRLQNAIRTERGYITAYDAAGDIISGYVKEGEWTPLTTDAGNNDEMLGAFRCTLEERYVAYTMEIIAQTDVFMINGEIQPAGFSFSIDSLGFLTIFDSNGKRLNNPVQYDKVRVNNFVMSTPEQLGMVLSQYANE